jgi:hypothetical protein
VQCKCRAHPTNPITGERAAGDLTLADIATNAATDDGSTTTAEVTARARRRPVLRAGQPPPVLPEPGGDGPALREAPAR